MRLTPQHSFSMRSTAAMLRTYIEEPDARLEGGFTKKRVVADAKSFLTWDNSIKPADDSLDALAYALDALADKAMKAPPMTSQEVSAMLRRRR